MCMVQPKKKMAHAVGTFLGTSDSPPSLGSPQSMLVIASDKFIITCTAFERI